MQDHARLRHWALCAVSAFSAVALSACGGGSGSPASAGNPGNQQAATSYTAQQLRGALLSRIDGVRPAAPVEAGQYGSLRGVRDGTASTRGVRIVPARCARAAKTGLDSSSLADAPATVVSFRHGSGGVSEVLLAPRSTLAARALGRRVPKGCTHYRAVVGGKTIAYTVKEEPAPHIGQAAREIRVHAAGSTKLDVWTVIYQANGYIGAVTLIGPAAKRSDVETIARMAYGKAERTLQ